MAADSLHPRPGRQFPNYYYLPIQAGPELKQPCFQAGLLKLPRTCPQSPRQRPLDHTSRYLEEFPVNQKAFFEEKTTRPGRLAERLPHRGTTEHRNALQIPLNLSA